MKIGFIYSLSDPTDDSVRYIGYSIDPNTRLRNHLKPSRLRSNTHKNHWINSLLSKGLKPVMNIVDEVHITEWEYWERFYINLFRSWNYKLTNGTKGGDGGNTIARDNPKYSIIMKSKGRKGRISNRKGIKQSPEQKEKISKRLKELYRIGKMTPIVHTKETIDKISKTKRERNKLKLNQHEQN